MNLKKIILMPFSDIQKFFIGALVQFTPIVSFAAQGYQLECAVKQGGMPSWSPFGRYFLRGFVSTIIFLIYLLPVLALIAGTIGAGILFEKPLLFLLLVVLMPLLLFTIYLLPATAIFYARGVFSDAFKIKKVVKSAFTIDYLVATLITLCIYTVVSLVIAPFQLVMQVAMSAYETLGPITFVIVIAAWLVATALTTLLYFPAGVITYTLYGKAIKK